MNLASFNNTKFRNNKKKKEVEENNNRINIVMAVIFLLVGALIYRLYSLQVIDYDLYESLADGQHLVDSLIDADRGNIFVRGALNNKSDVYPVATNKDFALVYAIPKDVEDPEGVSEKLYEIFDYSKDIL